MSLFRPRPPGGQRAESLTALRELADRSGSRSVGSVTVNQETALRHSAVWACLRQRASLLSTLPVDVYRKVLGVQVEVPKPPLLIAPGTDEQDVNAWLWATQFDIDRFGTTFGLITARYGASGSFAGWPARIELLPAAEVGVKADGAHITEIRHGQDRWSEANGRLGDVWIERGFTPAGLPLGLNPVMMAAYTLGGALSAQEFALNWFGAGGVPSSILQHQNLDIDPAQSAVVKRRVMAATAAREPVVLPKGWTWQLGDVPAASEAYMAEKQWSVTDVARFFDWPVDLIDGAVSGESITYANVVQRNLQALVMHLGSAITRRERALSTALPQPRFVKFNTDALLRMDPETVSKKLIGEVAGRLTTPSEARALMNRAPLTAADLAEFEAVFGPPRQPGPTTGGGAA